MIEENIKFVEWYNSLANHEKKFVRSLIALSCEVSPMTVFHWVKGSFPIKNPYRVIINRIAGKDLFDVIQISTLSNA